MKIDIQPGDTFTISQGNVRQARGNKRRTLETDYWWKLPAHGTPETSITREAFVAIARWAGHTIEEVQPQPAPVPWPTHAVVRKDTGKCIGFRGTEQECKHEVEACWGDHYEVRPLAPAPLSPNMLKFIAAIEAHVRYTERDSHIKGSLTNDVVTTAHALLVEGGGQ